MKQIKKVINLPDGGCADDHGRRDDGERRGPALNGRLVLRPLTPGDVTLYQLPASTETSPGLTTVGIGSPVYLEAEINIAIPASDIISVNWLLANEPGVFRGVPDQQPAGHECPRLWTGGSFAVSSGRARSFCGRTSWANTRWSPPLSRPAAGPPV